MAETVNHPDWYNRHPTGVEAIAICEHFSFNVGNAIKYLWRAGLKDADATEDLRKARWYITHELERLTGPEEATKVTAVTMVPRHALDDDEAVTLDDILRQAEGGE